MNPVILQLGLPGGPELLVVLLVVLLVAGVVGRWIYRDARARGSGWAWQWAVGIVLLFLVGLVPGLLGVVIYLLVRGDRVNVRRTLVRTLRPPNRVAPTSNPSDPGATTGRRA